MKKLEQEALLADRETVSRILASIQSEDLLGRMTFSSRLEQINKRLEELETSPAPMTGNVALLLGGRSVYGSRAIDADFASDVLKYYQDIIAKSVAHDEIGPLGSRGPVPFHTQTKLAITDVVRGSVGFILEEYADNATLVDTTIKQAISNVTDLLRQTSAEAEDAFEQAIESLDPRVLMALQKFFTTLDDHEATIRVVENERDEALDRPAVRRARLRVEYTEIEESDDRVVGRLLGIFPHWRKFEMQLDNGEVIHGSVAADVTHRYHELISDPGTVPVGKRWRVKMRRRQVRERNKPDRNVYTLIGLIREMSG
jgi:hypothetical protein